MPTDKLKRLLPSWTSLRDTCDKLFSMAIRIRDKRKNGGRCVVCNRRAIQKPYHIIPRSHLGIRWDPDNAVGACNSCNYREFLTRGGKHDHVDTIWIPRLGKDFIDDLKRRAKEHEKYSVDQLAEIRDGLKEQLGAKQFL